MNYMRLYPGDYLRDTRHLTTEQHGAYLLLLMAMWSQGGRLPNDPAKLARSAGVNLRRWHIIAPDVMLFFDVEGDAITQKRLCDEYKKAVSLREKRSVIGKAGGDSKASKSDERNAQNGAPLLELRNANQDGDNPDKSLKNNDDGLAIARHLPEQLLTSPTDPSVPSEKRKKDIPADAGSSPSKYAFEASTIKLTWKDLEVWRKDFPHISLPAELWALDEWAGKQTNWFIAVSSALAKKERQAAERIAMRQVELREPRRLHVDGRI